MSQGSLLLGGDTFCRYPYPGLRPFEKHESEIFFGRGEQVDQLLAKLRDRRFLAVVGPSGCGKSSLVRAGLLPALEAGAMLGRGLNWRFAVMRPGNRPMQELGRELLRSGVLGPRDPNSDEQAALLGATLRRGPLGLVEALREPEPRQEGANLLLLVDQFEEIFTYRREGDPGEAQAFVDLLLASASAPESPIYVVITMRTDHLGNCPVFPGLPEKMNDSQFLTPRLTREQCRAAVVGPAEWFEAEVDPQVASLILNEMGTDPDQLPLMQHLLMRMWRLAAAGRATGGSPDAPILLTRGHYDEAGGFAGALNNHADRILAGLRSDRLRQVAERMFRCLTEITPDNNMVRRRRTVGEICTAADASVEEVAEVVEAFRAEGRSLLMPPPKVPPEPLRSDTVIDISHESLIRQWKKLEGWTKDEHKAREVGKNVARHAQKWHAQGRPEEGLLTGLQLLDAEAWSEGHPYDVGPLEGEFLAASRDRRDRETRAAARRRVLFGTLGLVSFALAVMASITAWIASHARDDARNSEAAAIAALAAKAKIDSKAFAKASLDELDRNQNPDASLLLALEAANVLRDPKLKLEITPEVELALRRATGSAGGPAPSREIDNDGLSVDDVAFSRDGRRLVITTRDGEFRLWGLDDPYSESVKVKVGNPGYNASRVAISPDGTWLVVVVGQIPILYDLKDLARPSAPIVLPSMEGYTQDLAFAPGEGRWLAIGDNSGMTRVWALDPAHREPPRDVLTHREPGRFAYDLAFSDDGRRLASGDSDSQARVWDLESGKAEPTVLKGQAGYIVDVDFNADGRLATASVDGSVYLWRLEDPAEPEHIFRPSNTVANAINFAPDGRWLATGHADGTVALWDLGAASPAPVETLAGPPARILKLEFNGGTGREGGFWLAAAGENTVTVPSNLPNSAALWDLSRIGSAPTGPPMMETRDCATPALAFAPDGRWLAVGGPPGKIRLYDLVGFDPDRIERAFRGYGARRVMRDHAGAVRGLACAPDRQVVATASDDSRVRLWDLGGRTTSPRVLEGHEGWAAQDVAISPDGRWLASWSFAANVYTDDADCAALLRDFRKPEGPGSLDEPIARVLGRIGSVEVPLLPRPIAFDTRSRWMATGGGEVLLWDLGESDPSKMTRALPKPEAPTLALAFSPDGRWLATGDAQGRLRLWDGRSGWSAAGAGAASKVHKLQIVGLAFTPDGRLVSASWDGSVKVARVRDDGTLENPAPVVSIDRRITGLALAPAAPGHLWLASGDERGLAYLRDLASPSPTEGAPAPFEIGQFAVDSLAFSSGGAWLATGGGDGQVRVWALDGKGSASELISYRHEQQSVGAVAFTAGDRQVVSVGFDATAQTWPLVRGPEELLAIAPALVQRNLTAEEWQRSMNRDLIDYHETIANIPVHPSLVSSAQRLAKEGRKEEALERLRRLTEIEPSLGGRLGDLTAFVNNARALGLLEEARRQARSEEDLDRAREMLERAKTLDPELDLDPDSFVHREQALNLANQAVELELGGAKYREALDLYGKACDLDDSIGVDLKAIEARLRPKIDEEVGNEAHARGIQLATEGKVDEAVKSLAQAHGTAKAVFKDHLQAEVEARQIWADSLHAQGLRLASEGKVSEAAEALGRAHDLPGEFFKGHPDPEQEAKQVASNQRPDETWKFTSLLQSAQSYASYDRNQAKLALEELARLTPFRLDADAYIDHALARAEIVSGRTLAANLGRGSPTMYQNSDATADLKGRPDDAVRLAAESFAKAQGLAPDLGLEPERLARLYVGRALLDEARRVARAGRPERAREALDWARTLLEESGYDDPRLVPEFDPEILAGRRINLFFDEPLLSQSVIDQVKANHVDDAIALFEEAREVDPLVELTPDAWNGLCWFGCLSGDPDLIARVRSASDVAVTLMPEQGNYRDTRALARALSGDRDGAIADFEAYCFWTNSYPRFLERVEWIEELKKGTPVSEIFTPEVLDRLRLE
jgi:WD40 repeat protein/tetratricopeptide (TPR) repeat protein